MAGTRVLNQPLSANALARPGGICSMFRLPIHKDTQGNKINMHICLYNICLYRGKGGLRGTVVACWTADQQVE